MKVDIEDRVVTIAKFILYTKRTIREVAKEFGCSKANVHKDLKVRLPLINEELSEKVKVLMAEHIKQRYITGGNSTKMKWELIRKEKENMQGIESKWM
jgi:putative DeoR family transcriptional regulator (stage III sporulation protein D)